MSREACDVGGACHSIARDRRSCRRCASRFLLCFHPNALRCRRSGRGALSDIATHVEDVVRIPPVTGITADTTSNLYFSAMTEDGVLKMGPDRKLQTLIRDDRISGPNEGSIGPAPRVNRPYEVFKITLP